MRDGYKIRFDGTAEDQERFAAESIARFNGQECFAYHGDLDAPPWGQLGFVGQHRDSDTLERSNFEVITKDLEEKYPDAFVVERSGHWAVGWVEVVRMDTSNAEAVKAAYEWACDLDDYPVADEDHYSNLEVEEALEAYDSWGKADTLEEIEDNPEYGHMFDDNGELLEEFEDSVYRAFEDAYREDGFRYLTDYLDSALEDKRIYDKIVYERYQPPMFN